MALAGEQSGDRLDAEVARLSEGAEDFGARTWLAHDPGGRAFPAQRVIDEARYRRAVARALRSGATSPNLSSRPSRAGDGSRYPSKLRSRRRRGRRESWGAFGEVNVGSAAHRSACRVPVTAPSIRVGQAAAQGTRRQRHDEIFVRADDPQRARRLITERRRNAKPRLGGSERAAHLLAHTLGRGQVGMGRLQSRP